MTDVDVPLDVELLKEFASSELTLDRTVNAVGRHVTPGSDIYSTFDPEDITDRDVMKFYVDNFPYFDHARNFGDKSAELLTAYVEEKRLADAYVEEIGGIDHQLLEEVAGSKSMYGKIIKRLTDMITDHRGSGVGVLAATREMDNIRRPTKLDVTDQEAVLFQRLYGNEDSRNLPYGLGEKTVDVVKEYLVSRGIAVQDDADQLSML